MIPYRTNRVHNRWTWWYHFGAGDMGNDGVHDIDYTRWGLGVDTHPTKIVALGGRYMPRTTMANSPIRSKSPSSTPGDGKPVQQRLLIYEQRLWSTNYPHNCDSGAEFYGNKGQMFLKPSGQNRSSGRPQHARFPSSVKPESQNDALTWRTSAMRFAGRQS